MPEPVIRDREVERATRAADLLALQQPQLEPDAPTRRQLMMLADDMAMESVVDAYRYARAVLARWGRPALPQPVPLSERLPDPRPESEGGDCNTDGKCWLLGKVKGDWRLINPSESGVPHLKYCFTHWLPASALPLPTTTTTETTSD